MTVPGQVLAGRYRLVNRVATGGMGSVWEAWDELLLRRVAIKELLTQPGLSAEDAATARNRVIREARITARLHHPHAVTLYDVLDHEGEPCLVLQYVPSRTLSSILAEQGPLQVRFVTGVGAEIAAALAAAHHVGIVHRDVKPSNVLITPAGGALITDFGISHAAGDMVLTSTGMVSGTPAFLAPEVARGTPSGFPADVFSLGATLYAALEGTPPFGADQNPMAVLHKVASGQIIPPRRSGALTTLLGQMMAPDPAARPTMPDVARLLADRRDEESAAQAESDPRTVAVPPRTVRQWLSDDDPGTGASPHQPAFAASTHPAGRPRRRLGVLMAAAALLLAGVGAWLLVGGSRHSQSSAGSAVSAPSSLTTTQESARPVQRISAPTTSPSGNASTRNTTAYPTSLPAPPGPATTRPAANPSRTAGTTSTTPGNSSSRAAGTSRSATAQALPTAGQLAAAITGYYAVLPRDTDQGWAELTSKFQTGTAQNRQYYQRFWDSIEGVTATDAHGASPDTAEAKITYHFKDGRTAVEITVYSLVVQGGTLKIDSSTVLSSTIQ